MIQRWDHRLVQTLPRHRRSTLTTVALIMLMYESLDAWPLPFDILVPGYPGIFLRISKVELGGTARQKRWLISVLNSLADRIPLEELPPPQNFQTDEEVLVSAKLDETSAILLVPNGRLALKEGLLAFARRIPSRGAGDFEGAFWTNVGRVADFSTTYSHHEPPVPEPWARLPATFRVPGVSNKILRVDRYTKFVGDGWDKKMCVGALQQQVEVLEASGSSNRPSEKFVTVTEGPGDWIITYVPTPGYERYVNT